MKPLGMAYWSIALALCLSHVLIFIAYTLFCLSSGSPFHSQAIGFWTISGAAIVLLSISIVIKRERWRLWLNVTGVAAAIVLVGTLVWYLSDTPPIQNDYTEKNLRAANSEGYRYLKPFYSDKKAEALQRDLDDMSDMEKKPGKVPQALIAWNRISEYRTAIEQLDRFQTIHDLPENVTIELDLPYIKFASIKRVADVYAAYIHHKVNNGDTTEGILHLGRLHRVARKGMAGSTLLIHKFVFAALAQKTMSTAYAIIDNPHCSPDHLKKLKNIFKPLEPTEYDMTRVLIGEYLFIKRAYQQIQSNNFLAMTHLDDPSNMPQSTGKTYLQRPFFYLLFKPNMTLAVQRQYFDLLIAAETHQPPDYTMARNHMAVHNRNPLIRNMIGWIINNVAMPDFSQYSQKLRYRKVQSDLLACAISKRLKEPVILNDYYAKGPCRYEEKGSRIRSPGPDGRYDSEDDINLEKPE